MTFRIDLDPCINCGMCRRVCPTECIHYFTTGRRTHVIDAAACIDCGLCAKVCPVDCIDRDPTYVHDPIELGEAKAHAKAWARKRYETEQRARAAAIAMTARIAAGKAGAAR